MTWAADGLSRMLMHNASETTLRNVKRFHNPGSTLRLMVATLWEASSLLVHAVSLERSRHTESKHDAAVMWNPHISAFGDFHAFVFCHQAETKAVYHYFLTF